MSQNRRDLCPNCLNSLVSERVMDQFLIFQLFGPMASWGECAPGGVRQTLGIPTKSALLGILEGAVGITRDREKMHGAFAANYEFVICGSENPVWAQDFHTVQVPKENKKILYLTRKEELSNPEQLETILSTRDYLSDSWWLVAVKAKPQAPYSLEELKEYMERPTFTPYLGRKSNPSGLPFCPQIMSGDLKGVLGSCSKKFKEKLNSVGLNLPELQTDGYWERECQDLKPKFIIRRRDVPLSRTILSENAPTKNDLFQIETKEFKPKLRKGDRLIFSLRANPTVCRKGRRYDLFMDLKKRVPQLERQDLLILQQAEAAEWLKRQGTGAGFSLISSNVESYQGKCVYGKNGDRITFSIMDFSGVLEICDPEKFLRKLLIGFGKEKAFGCGLMLIRRQVAW